MEQRLNLITLAVPDVAASVEFYRDAFGWEPSFQVEDTAFFDLGGVALGLWSGLSQELGRESDPPPGATVLAHNVRSPQEVDDLIAQAVAGGASVAAAARTQPWGGYSGHIADPDGHLWEIAYNPDWPLDADGRVVLPW
ncbi:MAG: VOC family protein [Actinomycetota bacterium]